MGLFAKASCITRAERAGKYNDSIIQHQRSIILSFEKMDSVFQDTTATKESVDYHYAELQSKVKLAIMDLDSIGPFQKDPSLQLAAKNLFRTYESIVDKDYKTLKGIKLLPTNFINQTIADTSLAIQSRVHLLSSRAQDAFLAAQDDFGKKFNLQFQ